MTPGDAGLVVAACSAGLLINSAEERSALGWGFCRFVPGARKSAYLAGDEHVLPSALRTPTQHPSCAGRHHPCGRWSPGLPLPS